MSLGKKLIVIICLLFFFFFLFFLSCALVLFLAPGIEIFGVRYVSFFEANYEKEVNISSFSGDIYIETENVPINIEFSDYTSTFLNYHQNFTGYTTTKTDQAGVYYKIENEDLKISTTEFVKFLFAHDDYENFHFDLRLPAYAYQTGTRSIYITSNGSSVKIDGNTVLKNFDVKTSGGVSVEDSVVTNNLTLSVGKSLTIGENLKGKNLDITTTGDAYVNITEAVDGDIKLNTRGGDVKFVSCNNLYAETRSGAIRSYKENSANVNYDVEIKTHSGVIELGNLNTLDIIKEGKTKIETRSGKVTIKSAKEAYITSDSGAIYVENADDLTITNRIGLVEVKNVKNKLTVNDQNGDVTAGKDGKINDVQIESSTGVIKVYNTNGVVNIKSQNNNVEFRNNTSTKITLYAGKKLDAEKLKGEVTAHADGNTKLKFDQVTHDVSVEIGNKANYVDIDVQCAQFGTVSYVLRSTKGERASVYAGDELKESSSSISNTKSGQSIINVKSTYAQINLYFSAAAAETAV